MTKRDPAGSFGSSNEPMTAIRERPRALDDMLGDHLWDALAAGTWRVRRSEHSATHCILQLAPFEGEPPVDSRRARQLDFLRRQLIGEAQKVLAFGTRRSLSTIAGGTGDALAALGLRRKLLYVPYPIVRAAHVASGFRLPPCQVTPEESGTTCQVRVPRPESLLEGLLTVTEREVVALMVEGYSNDAIALKRGVSPRTVANQISSVFRRLEISGRMQLLCLLVRKELLGPGFASVKRPLPQPPSDVMGW